MKEIGITLVGFAGGLLVWGMVENRVPVIVMAFVLQVTGLALVRNFDE